MLTLIIFKCGVVKKKLLVWVWTLLLIHNLLISGSGKRACFRGKYCCLGALMGVPRVPDGQYVAPGLGWGGLRKVNALDYNIERVLRILTLLISGSGKPACFRGKYCYLGALIGTLGVPDGQYVAPGLGPGRLRKKNTSDDNIQRVLLTLTLLISGSGKHACFRGKDCYLGAPIGTPQVPDGWYVAPGLGWGGLRKENASDDNIERVLLILTLTGGSVRAGFDYLFCRVTFLTWLTKWGRIHKSIFLN